MDQKRFPEGISEAEMLTRVHPLFPGGWQTLGLARLQAGMLDAADEAYQEAERLSPRDADVPFRRGSVAWLQGRPTDAATHWRRAITLEPGHSDALRALALAEGAAATGNVEP